MKEKILEQLMKKYSGVATKKFLSDLADRMSKKITQESEIEPAIQELENAPVTINDLQSEGDRRATELQQKIDLLTNKLNELEKSGGSGKGDQSGNGDANGGSTEKKPGGSTEVDELQKKIELLMARLDKMESGKKISTIREQLDKKLNGKVPKAHYKNWQITDDSDVDKLATEIESNFTEVQQEITNSNVKPDNVMSGNIKQDSEKVKADIEANADKF